MVILNDAELLAFAATFYSAGLATGLLIGLYSLLKLDSQVAELRMKLMYLEGLLKLAKSAERKTK